MKQRSTRLSADVLTDVQNQFKRWREKRIRGTRIPAALWHAAVEAARELGVSLVATALRLDYYKLKERMESTPDQSAAASGRGFLEIPLYPSLAPECSFELEDGQGARLRVVLRSSSSTELETLARTLWSLAQ